MFSSLKKALIERLVSRLTPRLEDWFYYWLVAQNSEVRRSFTPHNCYYEFGVGWGGTMLSFIRAAQRAAQAGALRIEDVKIVGFDSFEGLPDKASAADDHPEWRRGSFAHSEDFIRSQLAATGFPMANVRLVKGFFEASLTPALAEELRAPPPSIVTVDVDYYSSTVAALDFVTPLLRSGAVFYFDDLYSFHLHPEMGQVRAINEYHGRKGYLSPLREHDYAGRTYMYSALQWDQGNPQVSGAAETKGGAEGAGPAGA